MSNSSKVSLLERLTGRQPRPRRAPEPADMGTAFGMEEWLSSPAGHQSSAPAPKAAARGWRAWWMPGSPTR
jgi:hypothetical protein